MRRLGLVIALVVAGAAVALAQRGGFGRFDLLRPPPRPASNVRYDGRFTFVRIAYQTLPGGYWYQGQPAWSHGTPISEQNLMRIADALTTLAPHIETNVLSLEDPEIFKYPVLYLIEPSWWQMTEVEARMLRAFLDKGGFVIIDDFKTENWRGGRGWAQFADNMARVDRDAEFLDLDVSQPIFHQFFDIESLDIFPQAYNAGQPIFRGLFEDNDPTKRMYAIANYQNDLSEFWEFSGTGRFVVDETNEAYKVGVNQFIYGLTH